MKWWPRLKMIVNGNLWSRESRNCLGVRKNGLTSNVSRELKTTVSNKCLRKLSMTTRRVKPSSLRKISSWLLGPRSDGRQTNRNNKFLKPLRNYGRRAALTAARCPSSGSLSVTPLLHLSERSLRMKEVSKTQLQEMEKKKVWTWKNRVSLAIIEEYAYSIRKKRLI